MDISPQFMPAVPDPDWAKKPLNPSGEPKDIEDKEKDAPFGLHFMTKMALRDIVVQRDLLVQFAGLVAAAVNASRDKYVPAAMENDLLESMILNVAAANVARAAAQDKAAGGRPPPPDIMDQLRKHLADALGRGIGAAPTTAPMTPGTRTQVEALYQASQEALMRQRAAQGPTAPPAPTLPAAAVTWSKPPPAPGPGAPAASFGLLPPSGTAAAAAATTPELDAKLAYAYLLFRGNASGTEIELIKKIFDLQDPINVTPSQNMLNLMQQLDRMMHNHQPGNWFLSPLNLGTVFYSYELKAAIERAIQIVRGPCGHPEALAIDLMTQTDVRVPFADLTALQISTPSLLVRYGGGSSSEERGKAHRLVALQRRFRDMIRVWRTVRGKPVQSWTFFDLEDTYYQRTRDMEARRAVMEKDGTYYTDVPRASSHDVDEEQAVFKRRYA